MDGGIHWHTLCAPLPMQAHGTTRLTRPLARPGSSASSDCTVGTVLGLNSCALLGSMGTHTLPVLGCTQKGACHSAR
jgi:hypothetical protein